MRNGLPEGVKVLRKSSRQRGHDESPQWPIASAKDVPETVWRHLDYHRRMTDYNHRATRIAQTATFVVSAAIPVATTFGTAEWAVAVLGGILMVLAGITSHWRWAENWPRHSLMVNAIQRELALFDARSGAYNADNDRSRKLQVRVEEIVSRDVVEWSKGEERDQTMSNR